MSIVSFIFATIKKSDYMSPDSEYTETHENKIYATLDKLGIAYQSLPPSHNDYGGRSRNSPKARLYFMQKSVSD